jgi:hypothetical protein
MLLCAALVGCGGPKQGVPSGIVEIERLAGWYQYYKTKHNNKPPPNEQELVSFIQKELAQRGATDDPQELLKSPRDGQKYVIQYGKTNSTSPDRNVAVYESEGHNGKKLLAFESKWSQEVDDGQLQTFLSTK